MAVRHSPHPDPGPPEPGSNSWRLCLSEVGTTGRPSLLPPAPQKVHLLRQGPSAM